jgi:spore coat protein U-like protein
MRTALATAAFFVAMAATTCAAFASNCSFQGGYPAPMTFPSYDTISGASVTATTSIEYTCNGNASVVISANAGTTAGNTVSNRSMIGATYGDKLPYTISLSASHAPIFGDGTGGTQTYSASPGNGVLTTITIYGIINAAVPGGAGDVHADTYSDSVTITMTF